MKIVSKSLNDTKEIAKIVFDFCKGGEVIVLNGDLGTGKTTFTKYFAEFMGITNNVTSPTFLMLKTYKGNNLLLNHFDLYRINTNDELLDLGFYEYLYDINSISIIEWNKFILDESKSNIFIDISYIDESTREFNIRGLN